MALPLVPCWIQKPVIRGVLGPSGTPESRVNENPVKPIDFWPFIGTTCHSIYNDPRGPPCSDESKFKLDSPCVLAGSLNKTYSPNGAAVIYP